jgi:TolB protein
MRRARAVLAVALAILPLAPPLGAQASQRSNIGALPVPSPDGKRIAFVSDRDGQSDLYVIAADGTGLTRVTRTPVGEGIASWTRDGAHLLFSSGRDTASLQRVPVAGGDPTVIATLPAAHEPRLFPDGAHVLYAAGRYPFVQLTVARLDGSDARPISDPRTGAFNPAISPDGRLVAYTRIDSTRSAQVWVMNADGSNPHPLMAAIDTSEGAPQWPAWSADSRRVAVQVGKYARGADHSKDVSHIWVVDVATGSARKLAAHAGYLDETPAWFPDGKRIAFQSNRTGRMEAWVMKADGSGAVQVTR